MFTSFTVFAADECATAFIEYAAMLSDPSNARQDPRWFGSDEALMKLAFGDVIDLEPISSHERN